MALTPSFFNGMKKFLLVLMFIGIVLSALSFFFLPGNYAKLFSFGVLILVANIGFMYLFVRVNDNKRPNHKDRMKEEKRFDFRK